MRERENFSAFHELTQISGATRYSVVALIAHTRTSTQLVILIT